MTTDICVCVVLIGVFRDHTLAGSQRTGHQSRAFLKSKLEPTRPTGGGIPRVHRMLLPLLDGCIRSRHQGLERLARAAEVIGRHGVACAWRHLGDDVRLEFGVWLGFRR